MKILEEKTFLHLSEQDCIQIQNQLSSKVIQKNKIPLEKIQIVAGVDTAYWMENKKEMAVCCIVVIDVKQKVIIEKQHSVGEIYFPYLPGCLAFRELPLIMETAKKLNTIPQLFLFDGNGMLHPRKMGLATHASFYLEVPTMGIAKKYFSVEGATFTIPENFSGAYSDIVKNGEVLGRAVRTHQNVKPIFVSVGNDIDIDTATNLTMLLTEKQSHIPIPTRYADLETHKKRKAYTANSI